MANASVSNFQELSEIPLLVAVTNEKGPTNSTGPPTNTPIPAGHEKMAALLATPEGQSLYKRRAALVEPGFAQLFQRFGRRLHYRGSHNVDTELKLLGTVHNLNKLFLHEPAHLTV